MDGIFVCYHNTAEIFGFQYIPRSEMDSYLYGNSATGDAAFSLILQLYNRVLNELLSKYQSHQSVLITFSTDKTGKQMKIYSQVYDEQNKNSTEFKNLMEYDLDIQSKVNNKSQGKLFLENISDVWDVSYSLKSRSPNISTYTKIRQEVKIDPKKKESMIIRDIRSNYLKPDADHKVVTGNWTHSRE